MSPTTRACSRGCGYAEELPPANALPPLPMLDRLAPIINAGMKSSILPPLAPLVLPALPSLAVQPAREALAPARVLLVDFPWSFDDKGVSGDRGAEQQYKTMSIDECKAFPMPPLDDLCVGFFWRVEALGKLCYEVVEHHGFVPKSKMTWRKTTPCKVCGGCGYTDRDGGSFKSESDGYRMWCVSCRGSGQKIQIGLGHYTRRSTEDLIIAIRKGVKKPSLCHPAVHDVPDIFAAPRGRHSAKPDRLYEIIERMYPGGPYTELFARRRREGWQQLGDELPTETA